MRRDATGRAHYTAAELFDRRPGPPLTGRRLDEVAFPLGGLGAGMVSLGGRGNLRDWEIRNRPAKGAVMPQAFFTLKCGHGTGAVARVLEGPIGGSYSGDGHTLGHNVGQGLPRFHQAAFTGRFPTAAVVLSDPAVPLQVELLAFNPFIPLNDKDSGLPVAVLIYRLTNPGRRAIEATVFGNLTNLIGDPQAVTRTHTARSGHGLKGLLLATKEPAGESHPELGTLALASPLDDVAVLPRWWTDHGHQFVNYYWEGILAGDDFPPRKPRGVTPSSQTGTVAVTVKVPAGATVEVPFVLAWHFPIFRHYWCRCEEESQRPQWRNWYATIWDDAWDVAGYTAANLARLREETERFRDALFASTLPAVVLDAVSSQISILKSPTCVRLTDGTFYGWEGCSNTSGCCEGSCTHVWNYAQALPYLFPNLQRSMREADWANSMLDDGFVTFRMPLPLGTKATPGFLPAADGQMGTVMQAYREWLVSGDTEWLKGIWPQAKQALEFAWKYWDADRDGVMEGLQHNTYDNEFYGPNTMMGSLYLGALRAGEEMARLVGDEPAAAEYRRLFDRGSAWTDEHLFNGAYYEQQVEPRAAEPWPDHLRQITDGRGKDARVPKWPAWQFGRGCLSDQLIGQWYAEMLGLGYLYRPAHVRSALRSIFAHNWKADLTDHPCTLRVYAVGDEAGLVIGSWPRGERPGDPFWFADEVWCGIEYQVAAHLIYEGLVEEGLAVVKGVRERYNGERRNPWDEIECGHHYARSMASYSLLLALSGFRYRAAEGRLELNPRVSAEDFRVFYSVGSGWGVAGQRVKNGEAKATVDVRYGELRVGALCLATGAGEATARVGRGKVAATAKKVRGGVEVTLDPAVTIAAGEKLTVTIKAR